jgi:prophage regulatory protein
VEQQDTQCSSVGRVQHYDLKDLPMNTPDRIIRLKTVLDRTGLSRTTLYRKVADGTFPKQVPISIHGAGWHESAVNRWIADPRSYRSDEA